MEETKMESEIKDKDNPIQKNPDNINNQDIKLDAKEIPNDKEPEKKPLEEECSEKKVGEKLSVKDYLAQKREFTHQTK